MFSFSKTPLVLASLILAALPTFTSATRQACTVSLKFPHLGRDAINNGYMQYQMNYDVRACEGTTIKLSLTSPSTATPIPCALTSRAEIVSESSSIFHPDAINMIDLFCAVEKQDMFLGEEYSLLINVDGQKSTKKFIIPSPESDVVVKKEKYGVPPPKMFCGATETLCPTSRSRRKGTYSWACLPGDLLTSCGGCPNLMAGDEDIYSGEDCTEIAAVGDVTCSAKKCVVKSCDIGHELVNNKCIPSTTSTSAFKYVSNGQLVKQSGNRVISVAGRLNAKF